MNKRNNVLLSLSHVFHDGLVLVEYEVLPAEAGLPEQIDIREAWLELCYLDRPRRVNILGAFSEPNLMLAEDEAHEHYRTLQKANQERDPRQLELFPEPNGSVEAGNTRVGVPVSIEHLRILVDD
jgi:hypothetical protein